MNAWVKGTYASLHWIAMAKEMVMGRMQVRTIFDPHRFRSTDVSPGAMIIAHYTAPTLAKPTAWILKISPYRKSKKILTAATLADALRGCDTYAQKEVLPGSVSRGLSRNARWRWEPASDSQKAFILKAWKGRKVVTAPDGLGKAIPATEEGLRAMKKGEAANLITRLKHGALVGPIN